MNLTFSGRGWDHYLYWQTNDSKVVARARINSLIEDCRRHPFTGIGKPEPLGGTSAAGGRGGSIPNIGWSIALLVRAMPERSKWRSAAIILQRSTGWQQHH